MKTTNITIFWHNACEGKIRMLPPNTLKWRDYNDIRIKVTLTLSGLLTWELSTQKSSDLTWKAGHSRAVRAFYRKKRVWTKKPFWLPNWDHQFIPFNSVTFLCACLLLIRPMHKNGPLVTGLLSRPCLAFYMGTWHPSRAPQASARALTHWAIYPALKM